MSNLVITSLEHVDEVHQYSSLLFVLHKDGELVANASLYWYYNTKIPVLAGLNVHPDHRKEGLGTKMQKVREDYARLILKEDRVKLFVVVDSWMYHWYVRRGYKPGQLKHKDRGELSQSIWMTKRFNQKE